MAKLRTGLSARRALLIASAAAVFAGSSACTVDNAPVPAPVPAHDPAPEPSAYESYVALGDSYAAMGAVGAEDPESGECRRSATNYATLLATTAGDRIADTTDVTCGGAVVDDLTGSQHAGVAPQLDALGPDTDLVTLSIGGNDIGFGGIVECVVGEVLAGLDGGGGDAGGGDAARGADAPCRDRLSSGTEAALAELGSSLDGVHGDIADRVPEATVVVTQYLPMLPADGSCPFVDSIGAADREWIAGVTDELNAVVADAAERAGHTAVLPTPDDDRSGCAAPDERWVDFTGVETDSVPMHPTEAGQRAMADAVLGAL